MANGQFPIHRLAVPLRHTGLRMDVPVFEFFFQADDDIIFDWRHFAA